MTQVLLVAGGQLDPNIGAVLRQCLARKIAFREILVGPKLRPSLSIDLDGRFEIDGVEVSPTACFVRHDVFLPQKTGLLEDARSSLNWFHSIRDWVFSAPSIRILNRRARSSDFGKYGMLRLAGKFNLRIPDTVVTTDPARARYPDAIRKPVAGGELTDVSRRDDVALPHPYFIQERLRRPELRIYRIGGNLLAYSIECPDIDYRAKHNVELKRSDVPDHLRGPFTKYCEALGLDFAAADFMQTADGEWLFLEVNSQPMFAAFDRISNGDVSNAIINWLTE